MGLVAEFEIHCEHLPFVAIKPALPTATMTVELQFNHGERPPFFVHIEDAGPRSIERVFDAARFVGEYRLVGETDETRRYQVIPAVGIEEQLGEYLDDLDGLRALARSDAMIERIQVTETGWIQSGRFADRDAFDEFRAFWQRNGGFTLRRLTRDGEGNVTAEILTACQREAIQTAYEMGYFEIPRTASLEDVAAELDITASSLSERLRRAQTQLVEQLSEFPTYDRPQAD